MWGGNMNILDNKLGEFKELNTDNKKAVIKYMEFLRAKQTAQELKSKRSENNNKKRSL